MIDNNVFWKEDFTDGVVKGGIYVRSFDLKKFLELVETNESGNGGEVVGLRFDGNNLEVLVKGLEN